MVILNEGLCRQWIRAVPNDYFSNDYSSDYFFDWPTNLTTNFTIDLTIIFSVTDYFTLLHRCNFSHNMDIKTFVVKISTFIKHFFNIPLFCAITLCKHGT